LQQGTSRRERQSLLPLILGSSQQKQKDEDKDPTPFGKDGNRAILLPACLVIHVHLYPAHKIAAAAAVRKGSRQIVMKTLLDCQDTISSARIAIAIAPLLQTAAATFRHNVN